MREERLDKNKASKVWGKGFLEQTAGRLLFFIIQAQEGEGKRGEEVVFCDTGGTLTQLNSQNDSRHNPEIIIGPINMLALAQHH